MNRNLLKVALYSGSIPSTTFIDRLAVNLGRQDTRIYLFGTRQKSTRNIPRHCRVYATSPNGIIKRIQLIFRLFALFFADQKAFRYLLRHYARYRSVDAMARYAPVLLHKPDIFHIQWAKSAPDWIFLEQEFGIPTVLSLRGAHINYSPLADQSLAAAYKKSFPMLSGAHAVSEDLAQKATAYGIARKDIRVIHTGMLKEDMVDQIPASDPFHDPVRILSVGRMHWKKGYDVALDGLNIFRERNIPFHYTIVAGTQTEELLYQADDLSLGNMVHFRERVPHKELYHLMDEADILLVPSVEEGIANVAVEAMGRGLLVLSSDCCGMPELIDHGRNGYLFRSYDASDLADKLYTICTTPEEDIRRTRSKALGKIRDAFTIDRMGNEMRSWYDDVLAR